MNQRIVPYNQAKESLAGHSAYIPRLQREYANSDRFGSITSIIEDQDEESSGDDGEFRSLIHEVADDMIRSEDLSSAFCLYAMLGWDLP